ncbi:DUF4124 domain-containing protein [Rheinheimera sp. YQF-2]|uniref:DUF4124 domain-containing protein n=1 Tax=Rheinheimera lutimaris TaxID=2740584 RepID=A0A7Y5AT61_9GAMM|nr:DUF4124 domain-containing protein [Rheinheimera lutimaris]NRQ43983.1 DUF4124 domain-containing protein [Rheinheimera lutimaris]
MKTLLILLLLSPLIASANVYKCKVKGVITYSQIPCSEDVQVTDYAREEATAMLPQNNSTAAEAAATMDRLSESVKKRDMRININRLQSDKTNKLAERNNKMAQLKESKRYSANNLAGAVRNESLSEEMAAVAAQYDTDVRAIDIEIDRLTEALKRM